MLDKRTCRRVVAPSVRLLARVLGACAGVVIPAFSSGAEKSSGNATPPACGMTFAETSFDWATAVIVNPSIRRTSFALEAPRLMKGSCARVDLSDPNLRYLVTERDKDWGQPMPECPERWFRIRTRRQTTRDFPLTARRPMADGGRGLKMLQADNAERSGGCNLGFYFVEP